MLTEITPIMQDIPRLLLTLVASCVPLLLPGLAWRAWFPHPQKDPFSWLADVFGLSLAASAVCTLAFFLLSIPLTSPWLAIIYTTLGLLAAVGFALKGFTWQPERYHFLVGALFAALLAWRFFQVRDLALPPWVDPLQHTLIVRQISTQGLLPATLSTDPPIPFYYHFGYHVAAALISWIAQLDASQTVLVLGQVVNAGVSLSLYRLALQIWGDWRRAALVALFSGFITHMPAYYTTWGRYPLLSGLLLLPLAMSTSFEVSRETASRTARWLELLLLTAGLLLTHYFASLMFALFGLVLFISTLSQKKFREALLKLGLPAIIGLLIASPWLVRVLEYSTAPTGLNLPPLAEATEQIGRDPHYLWYLLGPTRNHVFVGLALLAIVFFGWRKPNRLLLIWSGLLVLFSLPWSPQLRPFRPDHWTIVLFIPGTLFVAEAVMSLLEADCPPPPHRIRRGVLAGLLTIFTLWGGWESRSMLKPVTIFATQEDLSALNWINHNLPQEARFFINVAPWQYHVYRGVDGGWWITPLTGRHTLIPPLVYNQGSKAEGEKLYFLATQAMTITTCSSDFWELAESEGWTHIYIKEGVGSLQPAGLENCARMENVYQQGGIFIYQILSPD
ncbi:MAG: hypothetical protein AB1345_14495 [Chloroflexota bacterium]